MCISSDAPNLHCTQSRGSRMGEVNASLLGVTRAEFAQTPGASPTCVPTPSITRAPAMQTR